MILIFDEKNIFKFFSNYLILINELKSSVIKKTFITFVSITVYETKDKSKFFNAQTKIGWGSKCINNKIYIKFWIFLIYLTLMKLRLTIWFLLKQILEINWKILKLYDTNI